MFLSNTETAKGQNIEIKTYFGRNIWPKPTLNYIRLSTKRLMYYLDCNGGVDEADEGGGQPDKVVGSPSTFYVQSLYKKLIC